MTYSLHVDIGALRDAAQTLGALTSRVGLATTQFGTGPAQKVSNPGSLAPEDQDAYEKVFGELTAAVTAFSRDLGTWTTTFAYVMSLYTGGDDAAAGEFDGIGN